MTMRVDVQSKTERYLRSLRRELRDLLDEDVKDIVEEIRGHILDKTSENDSAETFDATLAALGTPEELAARYRTQDLVQRAKLARSPKYMLRKALRWAGLSLVGVIVFALSVVGYCLGGWLFVLGWLKLFHPDRTGVWGQLTAHDSSFSFQSGAPNKPGELLGWWLVPIGILIGGGLLILTFRFGMWSIRKFWQPRMWRENEWHPEDARQLRQPRT